MSFNFIYMLMMYLSHPVALVHNQLYPLVMMRFLLLQQVLIQAQLQLFLFQILALAICRERLHIQKDFLDRIASLQMMLELKFYFLLKLVEYLVVG